jgi:hypothetical protein
MVDQTDKDNSEQDRFNQIKLDQERLDQEALDQKALDQQEDAIEGAKLAMNERIEESKSSADVSGTDTVTFHHEPAEMDKVEPHALGQQETMQKLAELSATGAVSGHMTPSSRGIDLEEEEKEKKASVSRTATAISVAAATAEALETIYTKISTDIKSLSIASELLLAKTDLTIQSLDDMIEQAQAKMINVDDIIAKTEITDLDAADKFTDALESNRSETVHVLSIEGMKAKLNDLTKEYKQSIDLLEQKSETISTEISNINQEIEALGGNDPEKAALLDQKLNGLKLELGDIQTEISDNQTKSENISKINETVDNISNSDMSTEAKTSAFYAINNAVDFSENGSLSEMESEIIVNDLVDLETKSDSSQSQAVLDLITGSEIKIKTNDGNVLEGEAAKTYLEEKLETAKTEAALQAAVKAPIPKLEMPDLEQPENTIKATLSNKHNPYDASSYDLTSKQQDSSVFSAENVTLSGNNETSTEKTTTADEAGTAKTSSETGTVTMEHNMDEKTFTQVQAIEVALADRNGISREEFEAKCAEMKLSPDEIAKVEAALKDKVTEINDPTNTGLKSVVANEMGQENTNIMGGVAVAAVPVLALFGGQSIKQDIEVQGAPTKVAAGAGLNNVGQSFADSEQFAKTNAPGVEASYNIPYKNSAEAAPNDLGDKLYAAANNEKGDGTGSGGGAQQEHQLRMQQLNEINRPDMTNDPKMVS